MVRIVPSITTSPVMMLRTVPPLIRPMEMTSGTAGSFCLAGIFCNSCTIPAAIAIASTPSCGLPP